MKAIEGKTYANIIDSKVAYIFTKENLAEWNENDLQVVEIPKDLLDKVKVGIQYVDSKFIIIEYIPTKENTLYALLDKDNKFQYTFTSAEKKEYEKDSNVIETTRDVIKEVQVGDVYDKAKKTFNVDIEYVKTIYIKEANSLYDTIINTIAGEQTPLSEMISWETQEKEAKEYLTSKDISKASSIALMAKTRGVPLDIFANKIVEKATKYRNASSFLIGYRQKVIQDLESSKDVESLRKARFNSEFVMQTLTKDSKSQNTESKK